MALPVDTLEHIKRETCILGGRHKAVGCCVGEGESEHAGSPRCGYEFHSAFYLVTVGSAVGERFGMYLCQRCGLFYAATTETQDTRETPPTSNDEGKGGS